VRALAAVAVALALLPAAGCGGDEEPSEASVRCRTEAENAARADVVRVAYEQGRLGTQEEIEADLPGGSALFDSEGRMLPYGELEGLVKARFNRWVANDDYLAGPVQRDAYAAQDRVADEGWPACEQFE
jgi:hypothetical protein